MQTYTREEQCRLWLQSAPSLSWRTREALLTYFGCAESIFEQMGPTVQMMAGDKAYAELQQMKTVGLDALIDRLHRCGAEIIFCGRAGYPALLGEINDPPHALFIRGTPAEDRFSVAIVGSRRDTRYGRSQAFSIARDLAAAGVTVVSGLARGIDTAAHEGALSGGGRTVAVLGNGIDRVYPEENTRLAQTIVERGGAIISEFALGAEPLAHHFPIRNRIISGLCLATVVVEAPLERSGALITANTALEQGRDVFAVPGPIDASASRGCNRLIADGAGLVSESWDILREYQAMYPHKILGERVELPHALGYQARTEQAEAKAAETPAEAEALPVLDLTGDHGLTDDQMKLLRELAQGEKQVDDLIELTQIPTRRVLSALTMLELDGYVAQSGGKRFSIQVELKE